MTDTIEQNPADQVGRRPDYDVLQEVRFSKDYTQLVHIGGLYESEKGYITGNTLHGRLVLAPTGAKEALQEMRSEKAQSNELSQEPSLSPKP